MDENVLFSEDEDVDHFRQKLHDVPENKNTDRLPFSSVTNQLSARERMEKELLHELIYEKTKPIENVLIRPSHEVDPYEDFGDIVDACEVITPIRKFDENLSKIKKQIFFSTPTSTALRRRQRLLALLTPVRIPPKSPKRKRRKLTPKEYDDSDEDFAVNGDFETDSKTVPTKRPKRSVTIRAAPSDEESDEDLVVKKHKRRNPETTPSGRPKRKCTEWDYYDDIPLSELLPHWKRHSYKLADVLATPRALRKSSLREMRKTSFKKKFTDIVEESASDWEDDLPLSEVLKLDKNKKANTAKQVSDSDDEVLASFIMPKKRNLRTRS